MARGRARSPDSIKAEKMYQKGMKLIDIAKKLGVPDGTVRRWKSTQKWDEPKKSERSEKTQKQKANVRKKPRPQEREPCKNSGAPKGNKNAVKHGGYSEVYWGALTDEELEMIQGVPQDEELLLQEQIQLFAVREVRLMKAINQYLAAKAGQYIEGVSVFEDKRSFKNEEEEKAYEKAVQKKVKKGERLPGQKKSVQTNTGSAIDLVTRLERELTAVQAKKTKTIDALMKLRMERAKAESEAAGNAVVDDWISEVLGASEHE